MRYASIVHDGRQMAAVIADGHARPLEGIRELGAVTSSDILRDPPLARRGAIPLDEVQLRPVVPNPSKIVCVGHNYKAHVEEGNRDLPTYPVLFTKFATSLVGPFDPVVIPPESAQIDYEGELAVIIGQRTRRVPVERALDAVAGYSVANDISMRDYQFKTHQWLQGKAWDDSTPLGPHLVTADEIADPAALELRVAVNGEQVQHTTTDLMIFDIPTVISEVSTFTTLEPGDVILTGTPAGVGIRRDPPLFLVDGDVVTVEVDGVGRIENTMRAEPSAPATP